MNGLPDIAFFAIPKPFTGEHERPQLNALRSWRASTPASSVYLFADEAGVAELCELHGLIHVPDLAVSSHGTPLISDAFSWMRRNARERYLCYINADIILLDDLAEVGDRVHKESFLVAGRRWDLDWHEEIDYSEEEWANRLWQTVLAGAGSLHDEGAIDYFLFPRSIHWRMPPLIVGRPGWDNWVLFRARQLRMPVIEATTQVRALHQNHSYSHVPEKRGPKWEGPEGDLNLRALERAGVFGLWAATHKMERRGPRRPWSFLYLLRQAYALPFGHPAILALARPLYKLAKLLRLNPNRWIADRANPKK